MGMAMVSFIYKWSLDLYLDLYFDLDLRSILIIFSFFVKLLLLKNLEFFRVNKEKKVNL